MLDNLKPRRNFLTVIFAMMILSALSAGAQTDASRDEHLLETGRAGKLAETGATNELKIVSYNIRWRSGDELDQIVRWLKASPDAPAAAIIGLQEVDRAKKRSGNVNNAKVLAERLGMYYAWAAPNAARGSKTKEEETGVEILSFYPMEDVTRVVLTRAGPGERSRIALGATIKIGNTRVRVYSVHGETRLTMGEKISQFRSVLDDLSKFPKSMPAIVLGDFNSWELPAIDDIRKLFTKAGFTTPIPDDESTFLKDAVLFDLKLKLDWIWLRRLTPKAYGIDRALKVSDHFPLWTVATPTQ